jgi:predicted nucleic acid-binding protein
MKIVIDTNILVNAFVENEPIHTLVVHGLLLTPFLTNQLCLDVENVIKDEYENNVGTLNSFRKWYLRVREEKKVYFVSHKLNRKDKDCLSGYGCHEATDHAFVGVAFNSDKILISEDSDFGKGPKGNTHPHIEALAYLQSDMQMHIFDAKEAIDALMGKD